jgi:hypothetical protein
MTIRARTLGPILVTLVLATIGAGLANGQMYRSETSLAHFDGAVFSERSDIPGLKFVIA